MEKKYEEIKKKVMKGSRRAVKLVREEAQKSGKKLVISKSGKIINI